VHGGRSRCGAFGHWSEASNCFEKQVAHGSGNKPMGASSTPLRQRNGGATDSAAGQGPEVEEMESKGVATHRRQPGPTARGNWIRVNGLLAGDCFQTAGEGKASKGRTPWRSVVRVFGPNPHKNQANPMVACRVQQTCEALRSANRRSREKRQGRNMLEEWHPQAEGSLRISGSGYAAWVRRRGPTMNLMRGVR
jgi:hypothetical protein